MFNDHRGALFRSALPLTFLSLSMVLRFLRALFLNLFFFLENTVFEFLRGLFEFFEIDLFKLTVPTHLSLRRNF